MSPPDIPSVAPRSIRVLCVDDHPIVREGLARILRLEKDFEVVGRAESGEEAVELFLTTQPDVTLMDLQLPTMSGLDAIRAILKQYPAARIVALTTYDGDADIMRALKAGAVTYLIKDMVLSDLVGVIREVHNGSHPIPPEVRARLDERSNQPPLTLREIEVVELMAKGMRSKEIAVVLGISRETARIHVRHVLVKLEVHDRTAAVMAAVRRGIIHA
jgi:DNA-binding NarL/FixJ family response regulator